MRPARGTRLRTGRASGPPREDVSRRHASLQSGPVAASFASVSEGHGPAKHGHVPDFLHARAADGALHEGPHFFRVAATNLQVHESRVDREEPETRLTDAVPLVALQVLLDELLELPLADDHGPRPEHANEGIAHPLVAWNPVRWH